MFVLPSDGTRRFWTCCAPSAPYDLTWIHGGDAGWTHCAAPTPPPPQLDQQSGGRYMRLPTVISAGSQPTRRRQRPRLDPAALTRSDGLLPLRCTASWPRPDVRVAHLAGEL